MHDAVAARARRKTAESAGARRIGARSDAPASLAGAGVDGGRRVASRAGCGDGPARALGVKAGSVGAHLCPHPL